MRMRNASAWIPNKLVETCYICKISFSLLKRKHHCRSCGNILCEKCSKHKISLLKIGFIKPVRVCDRCFEDEREKRKIRKASVESLEDQEALSFSDVCRIQNLNFIQNESLIFQCIDICILKSIETKDKNSVASGFLYITNFRIVFVALNVEEEEDYSDVEEEEEEELNHNSFNKNYCFSLPLTCVEKVEKYIYEDIDDGVVDIQCRDCRQFFLGFLGLVSKQHFNNFHRVYNDIKRLSFGSLSGFYLEGMGKEYSTIYDEKKQLKKIINSDTNWRISKINEDFNVSASYPQLLIVPSTITDEELVQCSKFRKKGRLPVCVWKSNIEGRESVICRTSQPKIGLTNRKSVEDRKLIRLIAQSSASKSLVIIDCRPKINAIANKGAGAGFSSLEDYEDSNENVGMNIFRVEELSREILVSEDYNLEGSVPIKVVVNFMNMANIHVIRKSYASVKKIVLNSLNEDDWLSKWSESKWLYHISSLLQATSKVILCVQKTESVLIHCSDGWDRTACVVSLSLLLLDEKYRTTRGFMQLIESQWLLFGHKFQDRSAVADSNASNEASPVFILWLDAVHQILKQHVDKFEFNELLLVEIANAFYGCYFGTFFCNSECERQRLKIKEKTNSLWLHLNEVNQASHIYTNPLYNGFKSKKGVKIIPRWFLKDLVMWDTYFYQFDFTVNKASNENNYKLIIARENSVFVGHLLTDVINDVFMKTFEKKITNLKIQIEQEIENLKDVESSSSSFSKSLAITKNVAKLLDDMLLKQDLKEEIICNSNDNNENEDGLISNTEERLSSNKSLEGGIKHRVVKEIVIGKREEEEDEEDEVEEKDEDSSSPFSSDKVCFNCKRKFSLKRWKHHCRSCGNLVCQECSLTKKHLPHLGHSGLVRICDNCKKLFK